jgi:hypothetical protein
VAVLAAAGLAAGCDRPATKDPAAVARASITYMESFAASADTQLIAPTAATWGINDATGIVDPDTGKLSERLDFDLLDGAGQLLYRGVWVIPDPSLQVDPSELSQYMAQGLGKNGADLDPSSQEAQSVFAALRADAGLQPAP